VIATTHRSSRTLARVALAAVGSLALVTLPLSVSASADDDEVRLSGSCSGAADWEVRAKADDDLRIEFRGKVDSDRGGQAWRWKIKHNGWVSASGNVTTSGSSGSFEIRRDLVDLHGTDRLVFRAVRPRTGEVCRAVLDW
jgi:hypothetical protein